MIYRPEDLHAKLVALAHDLETPTLYRRDDTAEAEPAVLGGRIAVDELFG